MTPLLVLISPMVKDFIPPLAIAALIVGGGALIASSRRTRSEWLMRRIDSVRGLPVRVEASALARRSAQDNAFLLPGGGLLEATQREIIRRFAAAGVTAERALAYFAVLRLLLAAVFAILALAWSGRLAVLASSAQTQILVAGIAAVSGWYLPMLIIKLGLEQRRKEVSSGLPDALELLVVCVEAGLSLENALERVAQELRHSQPALADELALTWAEMIILPSRDQALTNLAERVSVPSVRSVVSTLSQTLRYGTPLAQSLRVAAAEMRNDHMTALEERANRLPALLTLPVMLFIMPTIFLIVGGPAVLRLIDILQGGALAHFSTISR